MLLDSNLIIYSSQPEHGALRRFIAEEVPYLRGRRTDRYSDGKPPGGADGLDYRTGVIGAGISIGSSISPFFIGPVGP